MATPSVVRKIPLSRDSKEFEHGDNVSTKGRSHFNVARSSISSCRFSCSSWCAVCDHQMQSEYNNRRMTVSEELVKPYSPEEYKFNRIKDKSHSDSFNVDYDFTKSIPIKQASKNLYDSKEAILKSREFERPTPVNSVRSKSWISNCKSNVQALYLREMEVLRDRLLELRENLPLKTELLPNNNLNITSLKSTNVTRGPQSVSEPKSGKVRYQKRSRTPPEGKRIRQTDEIERSNSCNVSIGLKRPRDCSPAKKKEPSVILVTLKNDSSIKTSLCPKEMASLSCESEDDDLGVDDLEFLEEEVEVIIDDCTDDVARSIHRSLKMNPGIVEDSANDLVTDFVDELHPCLRLSLFSKVPPFIRFSSHDIKEKEFPIAMQKKMKWKLTTITPVVIRKTLTNSGFRMVRKSPDWTGTWGKHMKSICFRTLEENQKLNHFPGTFQIGRKDKLWRNLYRFMSKYGKKEFGFLPRTYVLPQDTRALRTAWEKHGGKGKWIVKPPASARGSGIKVVHKWCQIPKKVPIIVQKYISNPYLINGSKFDLRLYVLVTSYNPLRVYMYEDGLVRFASVKYSEDMNTLCDRYMHLTNYSINKLSSQYTHNGDASAPQGHKWTVKTLWSYLDSIVDVKELWLNLKELVIKTMIGGECAISQLTWSNLPSRYCSYELFGVDVLLDEFLKPWLLEVNISPSLHSSSPLDLAVKGPLVKDLLNIVGFHIPGKVPESQEEEVKKKLGIKGDYWYDSRMYTMGLSQHEKTKQNIFTEMEDRSNYMESILEDLLPDDVRHLIQYEDELTQLGGFEKIFPTHKTHRYHKFFESPKYYNMLFDAWENKYHTNRKEGIQLLDLLCREGIHLDVSQVEKRRSQVYLNESSATVTEDSETDSSKTRSCSTNNNDDGIHLNDTNS